MHISNGNSVVLAVTVAAVIMMNSCAFFAGSPHENFKDHIYGEIGKSVDNAPDYSWRSKKGLLDAKVLPNGNIEQKYRYQGTCIYYFEIDPKTRLIVGARFEDSEGDCVVAP